MTHADAVTVPNPPGAADALSPEHQKGLARLVKLIKARPGRFQLLILDCRDQRLRDRLITELDAGLIGRPAPVLWLNQRDHPDFAAAERALVQAARANSVIHVTGGASWFDTRRWQAFNIRREAVAQQAKASIVLWLDPESVADCANNAIDLWAWRGAVIAFTTAVHSMPVPEPDIRVIDARTIGQRRERIVYLRDVLVDPDLPEDFRFGLGLELGDLLTSIGDNDEAEEAYRDAALLAPDERLRAVTAGRIADIKQAHGALEEALRIREEEQLPVYERLGDVRERAATLGKIADIKQARGELEEALRIREGEELPVYERLGDVRARAVTLGKIADIKQARGDVAESLRIREEEELPVYERLGDVRARAVTLGQIADIKQARGELEEALRIREEEELPVFERLGDVRERAVTLGRIADIKQARGELEEALRIREEEELPVFERLGDLRERAVTLVKIARGRLRAGGVEKGSLQEITDILADAFATFKRLGLRREIGLVGLELADLMAIGDRLADAQAVLDTSGAAFAALNDAGGERAVQALRARMQGGEH